MALLEIAKSFLVLLNRRLELLDIFGTTFPKRSLSLSVTLLAFLRRRVNLA